MEGYMYYIYISGIYNLYTFCQISQSPAKLTFSHYFAVLIFNSFKLPRW